MKRWLFFAVVVLVLIAAGSPELRPWIGFALVVGIVWLIRLKFFPYRKCEFCAGTGWLGSDKAARPCRPCRNSGKRRKFLAGRDKRERTEVS